MEFHCRLTFNKKSVYVYLWHVCLIRRYATVQSSPCSADSTIRYLSQELITNVFRSHAEHGGVRVVDFHTVTKQVCDLPSYCSAALFLKLQPLCPQSLGIVTMEAFLQYGIVCGDACVEVHYVVFVIGVVVAAAVVCGHMDVCVCVSLSLSLWLFHLDHASLLGSGTGPRN
jgi:hypothetical protein